MTFKTGEASAFEENWVNRKETDYIHWTRDEPKNQIQLAFRNHWLTFNEILANNTGEKKCLEVGCGRGSLSAYFSDDGWDCTLLDISPQVIEIAKKLFAKHDLKAKFEVQDCLNIDVADETFDLVFSIGLLEHFEDIENTIKEQFRVLKSGGLFIGYVVPEFQENVQNSFEWVNQLLEVIYKADTEKASSKAEIYRSDDLSPRYVEVLRKLGAIDVFSSGTYPLPMISFSPSFPFSLLPDEVELVLTRNFQDWLSKAKDEKNTNPWLCDETYGQAFIVSGRKK